MRDDRSPTDSDYETLVEKEYRGHADQALTEVIIEAVAEAANADPLDLPPMYEFIDPDAVNNLFHRDRTKSLGQYISFKFDEWIVSVHADGLIRVRDVIHPIEL